MAMILLSLALVGMQAGAAEDGPAQRGRALYVANCLICHQITGQGTPGVFPPLAKSDFLAANRKKAILAVLEGLSEPIVVNGRKYNGAMPPVNLDDQEVSDVFAFILESWGNSGPAPTAEEVKEMRAGSRYPTYAALVKANSFAPLPAPPAGYELREVIRLPEHAIRIIRSGIEDGMYVLGGNGNVWHLNPVTSTLTQILWGKNYLEKKGRDTSTWGIALDGEKRFFIVANRRDESGPLVSNYVTIYRTAELDDGHPAEPKAWFQAAYPWGVGPFNHSVNHAAIGPDGLLYVNSGSRTDGNEAGEAANYWKGGEHPLTACMWRLDPRQDHPKLEIYARGLRNAFGFCWNDKGELFASENGPDAHAPEELNKIEKGKHYGFPYRFSDWQKKPYPYTPEPPADIDFTPPIANMGPDGGFNGQPVYTYDPHSSPAGMVFLGRDFPGDFAGSFLVARVGNIIKLPKDVGFDVLQVKVRGNEATVKTALTPLGRPIDLCVTASGKVCVLEYSRPTNNAGAMGFAGRILELSVKKQ